MSPSLSQAQEILQAMEAEREEVKTTDTHRTEEISRTTGTTVATTVAVLLSCHQAGSASTTHPAAGHTIAIAKLDSPAGILQQHQPLQLQCSLLVGNRSPTRQVESLTIATVPPVNQAGTFLACEPGCSLQSCYVPVGGIVLPMCSAHSAMCQIAALTCSH